MVKFSEMLYERPDLAVTEQQFGELIKDFEAATSAGEQEAILNEISRKRGNFETQTTLTSIRNSVDTNDSFYEAEQEYFDKMSPIYDGLIHRFYQALVKSPFRSELQERLGVQLFNMAEMTLKVYSDEVVEDMQQENELKTAYTKLMSSAEIEFEGKKLNLSEFAPYELSTDRDMRRRAAEAKYTYLAGQQDKLDELYDKLVKVRTRIAHKLGFKNFVELGYARMLRSDYDAEKVKYYRRQILEHVVPVASRLRTEQAARLGLDKLKYYDEGIQFPSGNAAPKGSPEWIVEGGKKMYHELSPETADFFDFMLEHELMDLVTKHGKSPGGYCTFLSDYKAPFIFSNFNGTSHDIDVLTHEAGHAFQVYSSRDMGLPEYKWPTYEACEIHSMSMEFFTWPWMALFFKEDSDKYKYGHLSGSVLFLPYGVAVDEFQHYVYENPEVSPAQRRAMWREIEKKYLPHRDYDGNDYLENGGLWQKQSHIYQTPFYYIDYTLAQICAFQFWIRAQANNTDAWSDYVTLCKAGGSRPFLELVKLAGLESPFAPGCVPAVITEVDKWLKKSAPKHS